MPHLLGLLNDDVESLLRQWKEPSFRARQILDAIYKQKRQSIKEVHTLPKALRERMTSETALYQYQIIDRFHESTDGSAKVLLCAPDGGMVESVLIPAPERRTVCISTQIGCAMGCRFCASTTDGLERNLTAGEMVEQVMQIDRLSTNRISNVVFMGMGEPMLNLDNVLKSLRILNAPWGMNIGARRMTVSTIGIPEGIARLADCGLQVNLAISLHASNDALRSRLMPKAVEISALSDLMAAADKYSEKTGRHVTYEYILIQDVNDREADAASLARLLQECSCKVNLIPCNSVPESGFKRPSSMRIKTFLDGLTSRNIRATIRQSAGQAIEAACGQLRKRHRS